MATMFSGSRDQIGYSSDSVFFSSNIESKNDFQSPEGASTSKVSGNVSTNNLHVHRQEVRRAVCTLLAIALGLVWMVMSTSPSGGGSLLPVVLVGAAVTPTDQAICGFIAATNIASKSGYSLWSCNTLGRPITAACGSPTWPGVTCVGGVSGNVTSVALTGLSISGTIPSSVGLLTALTELNLYNNNLQSSLPGTIGCLTNLQFLVVEANELTSSLPSTLGCLTALTYLDTNVNKFNGGIPSELGCLTNLVHLMMAVNSISGGIPIEVGSLTKLQSINFYDMNLDGSIPTQMGALVHLTSLVLALNALDSTIPTQLGSLTQLIVLDLKGNIINGACVYQPVHVNVYVNAFITVAVTVVASLLG
jgi:hypothetical protein